MMQAGRGVVQQHGVRGLYRGLNITLLEIIPYAALQFGLYDTFTAAWSKAHRRRLSAKVISSVHLYNFGLCSCRTHVCTKKHISMMQMPIFRVIEPQISNEASCSLASEQTLNMLLTVMCSQNRWT